MSANRNWKRCYYVKQTNSRHYLQESKRHLLYNKGHDMIRRKAEYTIYSIYIQKEWKCKKKQIRKQIILRVIWKESPWFPLLRNGEFAAASKMKSHQKIDFTREISLERFLPRSGLNLRSTIWKSKLHDSSASLSLSLSLCLSLLNWHKKKSDLWDLTIKVWEW